VSYPRYAEILKWTALSLFSYVAVVFVADVPWGTALRSLFIPSVDLTRAYAMAVVAILGTTISPYLFFWQAGQEVEEERRHHAKPLCVSPKGTGPELARIRIDTITGMAFSSLVSLAIVFSRRRQHYTRMELLTSQRRRRQLRRCGLSRVTSHLRCLRWGSSAPDSWQYRC